VGFAIGFLVAIAITPRHSSPHNDPGVEGLIVLAGATLLGAVTGAVMGFIIGLRREVHKTRDRGAFPDG
jgi:hypothetical protein